MAKEWPFSCLISFYFGFIGLFINAYVPRGVHFVEKTFYRPDEEYRFPRWIRQSYGAFSMFFFPTLFLFFPLAGPFFWLTVPFLNEGFSVPFTVFYFLCLTVVPIAPFWVYAQPRPNNH